MFRQEKKLKDVTVLNGEWFSRICTLSTKIFQSVSTYTMKWPHTWCRHEVHVILNVLLTLHLWCGHRRVINTGPEQKVYAINLQLFFYGSGCFAKVLNYSKKIVSDVSWFSCLCRCEGHPLSPDRREELQRRWTQSRHGLWAGGIKETTNKEENAQSRTPLPSHTFPLRSSFSLLPHFTSVSGSNSRVSAPCLNTSERSCEVDPETVSA